MSVELAIAKHIELLHRGEYLGGIYDSHAAVGRAVLRSLGIRLNPSDAVQCRFEAKESRSTQREAPSSPEPIGFVYLMRNNRNGHVKIGWSRNPKVRETTLQSEEPEIELLASVRAARQFEAELHEKYRTHRIRGEWFALSGPIITALMSEVFRVF